MKKKIVFVALLLGVVSLSPIDYDRALILRVEEVVRRFHAPVMYRYIGNGLVEFTDTLTRQKFRLHAVDKKTISGKQPKKIISIDLTNIDTIGFGIRFPKIASIPLGHPYQPTIAFRNSRGEVFLAGNQYQGGTWTGTKLFQYISNNTSKEKYLYTGFVFYPFAVGRFYQEQLPHLVGDSSGSLTIHPTDDSLAYPMNRKLIRIGNNENVQTPRVFDLDGDGLDEIVFRNWREQHYPETFVTKYDTSTKSFRDVFMNEFEKKFEWGSWAVGDFDQDGRGEIVTTTLGGYVYFVENGGNDSTYNVIFNDTTRAQNAGYHTEGNDIDRDGRPECYVGSSFFGGLNNIAVYERTGDNDYEVSLWIEIKGVGALKEFMASGDVDGDGIAELCVNLGGMIIILKCTGDDDYRVIWVKTFPSEVGFSLFDLNKDGAEEVLITEIRFANPQGGFTNVFGFDRTTKIDDYPYLEDESVSFNLFPNPSNDLTEITIVNNQQRSLQLDLYNARGQYVKTIMNKFQNSGSKNIRLSTAELTTGIYYCVLLTNTQRITRKLLVLH